MCAGVRHKQARPSAAPVWCLVCRNKRSVDRQAGGCSKSLSHDDVVAAAHDGRHHGNRGRRAAKSRRHDWRPKAQPSRVGGPGVSIQGPAMRPGGIRAAPRQSNPADPLSTEESKPLARESSLLAFFLLARSAAASSAVAGSPPKPGHRPGPRSIKRPRGSREHVSAGLAENRSIAQGQTSPPIHNQPSLSPTS